MVLVRDDQTLFGKQFLMMFSAMVSFQPSVVLPTLTPRMLVLKANVRPVYFTGSDVFVVTCGRVTWSSVNAL